MNDQRQVSWFQEATNSLSGAFALLMRDEKGLEQFNQTSDGFWRSFSAIVLIIPIYLFASSTDWSAASGGEPKDFSAIKSLISLCVQWVIWPIVALFMMRALSCEKHYARYVTVFNWTTVLAMIIMAIPSVLIAAGLTNPRAGTFLIFMLLFITLYFEWYITSKALGTPMGLSAAIVAADFAVSLTIGSILG